MNTAEPRRARKELERLVEERTLALQNANELLQREIIVRRRTENVLRARLKLIQHAETHNLDTLLEATLDEAENLTDSLIGFFHFLEPDQKTITLQNWSTRTKTTFCKADGKGLHYDVDTAGVWVDCIRQGRPVIHNDYASLNNRRGLPPGHVPIIREMVLPVIRGSEIVAIFGVGNKPRDYTPEDVEVVSFLADLAWDIAERMRAEEALRKSRQMMMSVLDNFPGVVFWKDRNSTYLGCNRNFSQAAGLAEAAQIAGRNDNELPWKNDAEHYLADDRQVIESGVPKMNIVEPLLHADGRVAWFETCKVPLYDSDDTVIGVLGTSNDITERKLAEEALKKAHDELESRVRERTEQLSSLAAELSLVEERERRRIATELHDQVGQNLIMSKIRLGSLSPEQPAEQFAAVLGEIREQITRSIEGIRTLTFQLSPPLLYEVGFEAAVEWLAEEFEGQHGLQVVFQDDGKRKPLDQEEGVALYQMIRELLVNIVKHAKAKKVRIVVEKMADAVRIIVADDGSGIDGLQDPQLGKRNSGFGLFNIRQRIEYLGGELAIESKINGGSRVTLLFPLRKANTAQEREYR